jgi:hypothetical protein
MHDRQTPGSRRTTSGCSTGLKTPSRLQPLPTLQTTRPPITIQRSGFLLVLFYTPSCAALSVLDPAFAAPSQLVQLAALFSARMCSSPVHHVSYFVCRLLFAIKGSFVAGTVLQPYGTMLMLMYLQQHLLTRGPRQTASDCSRHPCEKARVDALVIGLNEGLGGVEHGTVLLFLSNFTRLLPPFTGLTRHTFDNRGANPSQPRTQDTERIGSLRMFSYLSLDVDGLRCADNWCACMQRRNRR